MMEMMLRYNILVFGATALLSLQLALAGAAGAAELRVVATIRPLHSLAAGVMEGVGAPTLLLKGAASPHGHALRPSEAKALRRAQVVFWVGPELETFLAQALVALAGEARVVALSRAPGLRLLHGRRQEAREPVRGGQQAKERAQPHPRETEPHLWLDPFNALAMVTAVVGALSEAYPAHAARFAANGSRLQEALASLHVELQERVSGLAGRPYVVFHDAFRYFEQRYGLRALGAVTVSPERRPGAKHLAALRRRIREAGVLCAFAEPQFEPALLKTLLEGTAARAAVLDPLGASLQPGPGLYFHLLRNLAGDLAACLAPPGG
jgi:zinc transport system substrate-binding protein